MVAGIYSGIMSMHKMSEELKKEEEYWHEYWA